MLISALGAMSGCPKSTACWKAAFAPSVSPCLTKDLQLLRLQAVTAWLCGDG
jgi:hypothetical protein